MVMGDSTRVFGECGLRILGCQKTEGSCRDVGYQGPVSYIKGTLKLHQGIFCGVRILLDMLVTWVFWLALWIGIVIRM